MFTKPRMLTAVLVMGSLTDRGTLPSAASCRTQSTSRTASLQISRSRMSPSMRRKFGFCSNGRGFSRFPVEKLSRTVTLLFCPSSFSARLEPMNPAPPVIRIREFSMWRFILKPPRHVLFREDSLDVENHSVFLAERGDVEACELAVGDGENHGVVIGGKFGDVFP